MANSENTTILVNLKEALEKAEGGFEDPVSRYNGGWCKHVVGLDKSKDNGYSLLGDFVNKIDQRALQSPGLYLDCDIGGSRKNQRRYYTLFELKPDATVRIIETISDKRDYAVRLWPAIEGFLATPSESKLEGESVPRGAVLRIYSLFDKLHSAVIAGTDDMVAALNEADRLADLIEREFAQVLSKDERGEADEV